MNTEVEQAKRAVADAQHRVDALVHQRDSVAAELLVAEAALRCAHSTLNGIKAADSRLLADSRRDELAQLRDRIAAAKQPLAEKVDPVQAVIDDIGWTPTSFADHLAKAGVELPPGQADDVEAAASARFTAQASRLITNRAWPNLSVGLQHESLDVALAAARSEQLRVLADATGEQ